MHTRQTLSGLAVGLLLFGLNSAITAFAFEPNMGHKPIVTIALKVYQQCFSDQTDYQSEAAQDRVIQGDVAMDEGLDFNPGDSLSLKGEDVFSKLRRPLNWHFYNPDRTAFSRVGWVEQSNVRLWDGLIEGFGENDKAYNQLLFVGGIIHLVEDLSVPAHVVPVYHGPTGVKTIGPDRLAPLVSYMQDKGSEYSKSIADNIDTIAPDVERLENVLLNDEDICSSVETENQSLEDIRSSSVQFTYDQLWNEIPDCPEVTWQDFWLQPTGDEYFGRYNIAQSNPLFGEAGVMTSSSDATCQLEAMDSRYLDFVFALHLEAVEADLKVLYWGSRNFGR